MAKKKTDSEKLDELLALVKEIHEKLFSVETKDEGPGNPPPGPPGSGGGGGG